MSLPVKGLSPGLSAASSTDGRTVGSLSTYEPRGRSRQTSRPQLGPTDTNRFRWKPTAALNQTVVAFEIDHIDDTEHGGWSVLAVGVCRIIIDADELARLESAHIESWLPEPTSNYVAIHIIK
jgi:hypothetical protein